MRPRVAVVLFNLGGPDRPESIRPFLLNLFRDPAILRVPFFVRPVLARIIARARVKPASENYALLGGKSPLLELTQEQGVALDTSVDAASIAAGLPEHVAVQGNLDPIALIAGGAALQRETLAIRDAMRGRPHIFNLGHGILPQTSPAHVADLVGYVRQVP